MQSWRFLKIPEDSWRLFMRRKLERWIVLIQCSLGYRDRPAVHLVHRTHRRCDVPVVGARYTHFRIRRVRRQREVMGYSRRILQADLSGSREWHKRRNGKILFIKRINNYLLVASLLIYFRKRYYYFWRFDLLLFTVLPERIRFRDRLGWCDLQTLRY